MTPFCHRLQICRATLLLGVAGSFLAPVNPLQAAEHWSLQAVARAEIPAGSNPVDHFIQQSLAERGLSQNPPADRYALLRRATISLTGLPPTAAEIEAFGQDSSEEAWGKLIDRLLASPHYGERWGRHWLDVARYVQGTIKVPGIDQIDLAAPYRDYVVRSLNQDKPYDRFIAEQLAGDLLAEPGESEEARLDRLTAPAFLSIGQWFEECTDPNKLRLDIVDEQISATTRAFLAMDFSCARCHDHKYDPVPTRDYYALAGIFRSTEITDHFSEEWKDGRPRAVMPLAPESALEAEAARQKMIDSLHEKRREMLTSMRETVLARQAFPLTEKVPGEILAFEAEDFAGHKNLNTVALGEGEVIQTRRPLDQWVKYRLMIPAAGDYSLLVRYAAAKPAPVDLEIEGKILPEKVLPDPTFGESKEDFRWAVIPLPGVAQGSLHLRFLADVNEPFPTLDQFRLVSGLTNPHDLTWREALEKPTLAATAAYLSDEEKAPLLALESTLTDLLEERPFSEFSLAVRDDDAPRSLPVHVGGDVYRTEADPVPRGVPGLADHLIPTAFPVPEDQSGRIELAKWLAHPDHPLTARVMVNRIWHWHFGTGLVRTTDDFGLQGSPPTHPELLDWLAAEFIESGWSLKHLHRLIMNSDTYRASSRETPENRELDPDGNLLSRFPVRRLEVEAIYDGMISSIGKVARQPGGEPLDANLSKDRALYILTSSRSPLGLGMEIRKMFPLFGFDESGRPMHDRDESLTPGQSLWWLNNPLPRHYAETLAEGLIIDHSTEPERAAAAYQQIMGMPLDGRTEAAILRYVTDLTDTEKLSPAEAWTRACLGLFSSHAYSHLE